MRPSACTLFWRVSCQMAGSGWSASSSRLLTWLSSHGWLVHPGQVRDCPVALHCWTQDGDAQLEEGGKPGIDAITCEQGWISRRFQNWQPGLIDATQGPQ